MNEFFWYGLIGGALPDLIRIVNNRYNQSLPDYLKSPSFYIGFTVLLVLGVGTVQVLGADSIQEALALGYSAPQVISSLLGAKGQGDETAKGGDANERGLFGPGEEKKPSVDVRKWWGM